MQSAVALAMALHAQHPGCRPIEVLNRTLESYKVSVFLVRMPDSVSGFTQEYRGKKCILLNSNHAEPRRTFTLAHELYHILAKHQPSMLVDGEGRARQEISANRFAACLLMPAGQCRKMIDAGYTVDEIAHAFGVSPEAARRRMCELVR